MAGSPASTCGWARRSRRSWKPSGPAPRCGFGAADDRFTWEGEAAGLRHGCRSGCTRATTLWLWRVQVENAAREPVALRRDAGAGPRPRRPRLRHEQRGLCLAVYRPPRRPACALRPGGDEPPEPGAGRPRIRGSRTAASRAPPPSPPTRCSCSGRRTATPGRIDPGCGLPGERLQHEVACPMIQSPPADARARAAGGVDVLRPLRARPPGGVGRRRPRADRSRRSTAAGAFVPQPASVCAPVRSLLQDAAPVAARPLDAAALADALSRPRARGDGGRPPGLVLRAGRRAQPPRRAARQGGDPARAATAPSCAPARACCSTRRRCARPAGCTGSSPRCSRSATPRSTGCSRRRATPTTSSARAGCGC